MLIKVCGLTTYEDVEFCDYLGINFVGFIFYKKSPRCIDLNFVREVRCKNSLKVGVFVDHTPDEIVDMCDQAKLDLVQLHGDYLVKDILKIGKSRVIKVLWPDKYHEECQFIAHIEKFMANCQYILIDSGKRGGGHGRAVNNLDYLKQLPHKTKWFLAGGLGVHNIFEILQEVNPTGVDLNSGVEVSPGIKDKEKIELICNKIKELS